MPFPKGDTAVADTDSSSGESRIDALLSQDSQTPTDTDTRAAEDTSVADADVAAEAEETEQVESEAEGDDSGEGSAEGDEEGGETDLELTDEDRDFSPDAYTRAAQHYSKQFGKTLDPNDPADRKLLGELMERGQRIKELQQTKEEEPEEEETALAKTEEVKPTVPVKLTPEQIKAQVAHAREYAKSNIVPEVAMDFANSLMASFWPGKEIKISQEQANSLAETFSTFAIMQIADAMPAFIDQVPNAVTSRDPMFARMRERAVQESAIDEVLDARGEDGKALYPDFEKLADSGQIKRLMNGPELKEAQFSKDPYKNYVAKLKFAYKLARNQPVDSKALSKAAARGRESERERNTRIAAGKLPPGNTRSFAAPSRASNFIGRLVGDGGSKFHNAIVNSKK